MPEKGTALKSTTGRGFWRLSDVHCVAIPRWQEHIASFKEFKCTGSKAGGRFEVSATLATAFHHPGNYLQWRLFCPMASSAVWPTIFGDQLVCETDETLSPFPIYLKDYNCLFISKSMCSLPTLHFYERFTTTVWFQTCCEHWNVHDHKTDSSKE